MINLQAIKLSKTLLLPSGEVPALVEFSASFEARKCYAVTGPSGCGKSTLLYLLGLLDTPTSGEIILHGIATGKISAETKTKLRNQNLGFVFQFHFLLPELTVTENIILPALKLGLPEEAATLRAQTLLKEIGLAQKADRLAWQLSGGEQQRVAVARCLINNPPVVLADEPTGNLDTHNSGLIFDLLSHACIDRGSTLIIVTHNSGLAARCDVALRLKDGKLVE